MKTDTQRIKRQTRIRKKIGSTSDRPRLSVFRSNQYCYAQVIDTKGNTLFGLSEKTLRPASHPAAQDKKVKLSPIERAKQLGNAIAKLTLEKKIKEIVFDKGRFAYHGRIKAIADGAREGGLQF